MTIPQENNAIANQTAKPSDKELNFRAQEARYEKLLAQERQARVDAEKVAQEAKQRQSGNEDDDDDEPYVDKKKLAKQLNRFGEQQQKQTQTEIQKAVQSALGEERKQNWLKTNSDFYDVLQHAEKFAQTSPELAESILEMPEGFERQKLVYKNIKALGLHQPEKKQPSIQDKIDSNKRSPYYQPTSVGAAPYASTAQSDFSDSGQKQAYQKMQELKKTLRI